MPDGACLALSKSLTTLMAMPDAAARSVCFHRYAETYDYSRSEQSRALSAALMVRL
jgi:hypothetical protein